MSDGPLEIEKLRPGEGMQTCGHQAEAKPEFWNPVSFQPMVRILLSYGLGAQL